MSTQHVARVRICLSDNLGEYISEGTISHYANVTACQCHAGQGSNHAVTRGGKPGDNVHLELLIGIISILTVYGVTYFLSSFLLGSTHLRSAH